MGLAGTQEGKPGGWRKIEWESCRPGGAAALFWYREGRACPSPRVSPCPGSNDSALWAGWDSLVGWVPHVRGTRCHPGPPLPRQEGPALTHLLVPLTEIPAPWQREGREAACTCGHAWRTPSLLLRRAHAAHHPAHHPVEEQLICKRTFLVDEDLLDVAGRFPGPSPGGL